MFNSKFCDEINVKDYILEDFSTIKLAEPTLEIVFGNTKKHLQPDNGQLRCKGLIFPFAKDGSSKPANVPIKQISTIVEATAKNNVKEVLELTLDTAHTFLEDYAPGDTIAILPHNIEAEVEFLLNVLQLNEKADEICKVQIHPSNPKKNMKISHIPEETTPRELLRDLINIRAVPKKQFLRSLAQYCTSKDDSDFLNCLASKEGTKNYNELLLEKGLGLCDLLSICSSCQPELRLLAEHLPRLLPRPYSIANCPLAQEHELKIIFSILNERPGVTTNMLASKANQNGTSTVIVYPRQLNNFRYTADDLEKNQILIAIGTGVAPFLGFLEHKSNLSKANINSKSGSTWLFMGAPTEAAIPYRNRLLEYQTLGILQNYYESFSRVSDANFHYVQDQLMANAQQLIEFLMQIETTLYVCADGAQISQSIAACLITCLQKELHLTLEQATEMLKQFRLNGKYREDLWT